MHKRAKAKGRNSLVDRPPSEMLKELHIYKVPRKNWLKRRQLAKNQVVDCSISMGFLRVLPEITLTDLRHEMEQQLQDDFLSKDYVFLRSVGRNFTQIKPSQEIEIKAKYFSPPLAQEPELYILEGSYISRTNSSIENSDVEELHTRTQKLRKDIQNRNGLTKKQLSVGSGLPIATKESNSKFISDIQQTMKHEGNGLDNETQNEAESNADNFHHEGDDEADASDINLESLIDAKSSNDNKAIQKNKTMKDRVNSNIKGSETGTKVNRTFKTRQKNAIRSKYKGLKVKTKKVRSRAMIEKNVKKHNDTNNEKITIEEKIEMLSKDAEDDSDPNPIEGNEILEHQRIVEGEDDAEENANKLKIDVNAELLQSDTQYSSSDKEDERNALLDMLETIRRERINIMEQREGLFTTLKGLQSKEQQKKRQYQEEWKKRYLDAKKLTPQLEDKCSKLKLELEKLHKTFLSEYESGERKYLMANGKPSNRTTHKITISRLYGEIDDLTRKVETAKVRLSTETKLRTQAENEVKILRQELTNKKIHVTLTRTQKVNSFAPMKRIDLSVY